MDLNKKIVALLQLIILVSIISGCGGGDLKLSRDEKSTLKKYKEWKDAVMILDDEGFTLGQISNQDGLSFLFNAGSPDADFKQILDADTVFVDQNPDYFKNVSKRKIGTHQAGMVDAWLYGTQVESRDLIQFPELKNVSLTQDGKLRYTRYAYGYMDILEAGNDVTQVMVIQDDILFSLYKNESEVSWVKKYPELKALALIASSPNGPEETKKQYKEYYEKLVDKIQTQNPDVQVYFAWEDRTED